jgi:hypothetical protein
MSDFGLILFVSLCFSFFRNVHAGSRIRQSLIQRIPEALPLSVKLPGRESFTLLYPVPRLRMCQSVFAAFRTCPSRGT